MKRINLRERLGLDNAEDADYIEEEHVRLEIARQIYDLRTEAGLTQRQLADRVGTSHSQIARLEDCDYEGHSMATLRRIARALGKRLEVRFVTAPAAIAPEERDRVTTV